MRTYSTSAIVLKRIDLAEKDRILTLYTRELGKVSAVAKGARKPGSKLSGSSEPFTYLRGMLSIGRELDVLTQSDIRESFPNAKSAIVSLAYGFYIMELVNQLTDDRHPNPGLFDTILSAMYVLESGSDPEMTVRYFELNLLESIGYMPQFDCCVRCGLEMGKERVAFSPEMGGVVCKECGIAPGDSIWVPGALGSYVQALIETQPHKLKDLTFPEKAKQDLAITLKWHIRYRLERDLKSIDFLDMVSLNS
jgi:DNA repair protein RecO (recombination protein O)